MEETLPTNTEELYDATAARRERCAPIVEKLLEEMLSKDLLLGDRVYIEHMVKAHLDAIFKNLTIGYVNEVFNMLDESLSHSLRLANEKIWDKPEHEVTLQDLEKKLKG
jgi:hypothetical protein